VLKYYKILFFLILLSPSFKGFTQKYYFKTIDEKKTEKKLKRKFDNYIEALDFTQKLLSKKQKKGYIKSTFDSVVFSENQIIAYIEIGEKYFLKNIILSDINDFELKKIGINVSKFENKSVNFEEIDRINNKIITYYENNGFPFAEVKFDSVNIYGNSINLEIQTNKGDFYLIDTIYFTGKYNINAKFLSNYIDIFPNDIYDERKINAINQNINELEFVKISTPAAIEFHSQNADLYIFLEKKEANSFNGVLGFLPNTKNPKKLLITGDLDLKIVNSFKQGETFSFKWQKYKTQSQSLDLYTNFPYIGGSRFGIEENFILEKSDTSFLKVNNISAFQYFFSTLDNISIYFSGLKSYKLNDNFQNTENIKNFNSKIYGLRFQFNQFDYKPNPKSGYGFELKSGYGTKFENDSTSSKQSENELTLELFFPIIENFVLNFKNQSAIIYNKNEIFFNELYQLGGLKTLRGFDEKSVFAARYSIFSLEIRYLYEKNSNVYLFTDFGYLSKQTENEYINHYPVSFGTGLNFSTNSGIFSLSYGIGKISGNEFIIKNGKIHFGFISIF